MPISLDFPEGWVGTGSGGRFNLLVDVVVGGTGGAELPQFDLALYLSTDNTLDTQADLAVIAKERKYGNF